jgi:hypothetical protein
MSEKDKTSDEQQGNQEIEGNVLPPSGKSQITKSKSQGHDTENRENKTKELKKASRRARLKKWFIDISLADVLMILFTGMIAYATFTYTGYAKRQWRVMRDQLKEMRGTGKQTDRLIEQASNQVQATKEAVAAAKNNIETIRDNIRLDQRAWIGITSVALYGEIKKGLQTKIQFKNTGKTPALQMIIEATHVRGEPKMEIPAWPWKVGDPNRGGDVLAPNASRDHFVNISDADIEELKKEFPISVIGSITYSDIFGRDHRTHFCYVTFGYGMMYCAFGWLNYMR